MRVQEASDQKTGPPRTIAVTGGKGGVGKTSVALNLALTLARQNKRVLLLDADTDLANISIMLGRYPERSLANVVSGECDLQAVLLKAEYGLHIVPGASGVQACMDMAPQDSLRVLRALSVLERRYDYVITDTAAGLQPTGLHMIAASELACVVVTPDPASLTDAFSLIKVLKRRGYKRTPSILINMAQGASQARSVFHRLDSAVRRHLGGGLHYMGGIWRDETLRQSVLIQKPVALLPLADPSCRQFNTLADMIDVRLTQQPPRKAGIAAYWHSVSRRQPGALAMPAVDAPATPRQRCMRAVGELQAELNDPGNSDTLRPEVFGRLFELLGPAPDTAAVEIIRKALDNLSWDHLESDQRQELATCFRRLAGKIHGGQDSGSEAELSSVPGPPEPSYDHVRFGDQDSLVKVLKEQPANVPLDHLLEALAQK